MPQIDKHAPGTFCWVELGTTDQDAAKKFYCSLFGWTFVDFPMGPTESYTMFKLNGRDAAAGYTMRAAEQAQGVPPHWNLYVAVQDADISAARAVELGGTLPAGVFDVYTNGRMAVVIDPTGAAFCLWQPKQTPGIGVIGEKNAYCWADLTTGDRMAAKKFYEGLFAWEIAPGKDKDDSTYLHISVGGSSSFAGIMPDLPGTQGVPPHWTPYFLTDNVAETSTKAEELGAKILVPATLIGGTAHFSLLSDPQGAIFALFQS